MDCLVLSGVNVRCNLQIKYTTVILGQEKLQLLLHNFIVLYTVYFEANTETCLNSTLHLHGSVTPCTEFLFNGSSFRSEFGIVCDRSKLGTTIMSIAPGAAFIGAFISGPISDHFGRRRAIILSSLGLTCFSFLNFFTTSIATFAMCFVCQHISVHMGYVVASVYAIEILGPNMRHLSIARKSTMPRKPCSPRLKRHLCSQSAVPPCHLWPTC